MTQASTKPTAVSRAIRPTGARPSNSPGTRRTNRSMPRSMPVAYSVSRSSATAAAAAVSTRATPRRRRDLPPDPPGNVARPRPHAIIPIAVLGAMGM